MEQKRCRGWCFTHNNYKEEDFIKHELINCKYIVIGKEIGESGTPHFQGFIYFENAKAFSSTKKILWEQWPNCHIEAMRGTPEQAITYCKKDGNFGEKGEAPMSQIAKGTHGYKGAERFMDLITKAESQSMDEIKLSDPKNYIVYYNTLKKIETAKMQQPEDLTAFPAIWIHGSTGTGKSYGVRKACKAVGFQFYDKLFNKWWDGYHHQEVALMDDAQKSSMEYLQHHLKRWMDVYSFTAEIKGGTMSIRPQWMIVTSQYTISQVFENNQETIDAITRRCGNRVIEWATETRESNLMYLEALFRGRE